MDGANIRYSDKIMLTHLICAPELSFLNFETLLVISVLRGIIVSVNERFTVMWKHFLQTRIFDKQMYIFRDFQFIYRDVQ